MAYINFLTSFSHLYSVHSRLSRRDRGNCTSNLKLRIFWSATKNYLAEKSFCAPKTTATRFQTQNFLFSDKEFLAEKNFCAPKTHYFCNKKFPNAKKRLKFKVKNFS